MEHLGAHWARLIGGLNMGQGQRPTCSCQPRQDLQMAGHNFGHTTQLFKVRLARRLALVTRRVPAPLAAAHGDSNVCWANHAESAGA
eukprot:6070573-Alexandrium_andersonii.AAC.1